MFEGLILFIWDLVKIFLYSTYFQSRGPLMNAMPPRPAQVSAVALPTDPSQPSSGLPSTSPLALSTPSTPLRTTPTHSTPNHTTPSPTAGPPHMELDLLAEAMRELDTSNNGGKINVGRISPLLEHITTPSSTALTSIRKDGVEVERMFYKLCPYS